VHRRQVLGALSFGGLALATGCVPFPGSVVEPKSKEAKTPSGRPTRIAVTDFSFAQISDVYWGYESSYGFDARTALPRAIELLNQRATRPSFVVFTGDLTHATNDPALRRKRMQELRDLAWQLRVPEVRFIPGDHDTSLDGGEAFREVLGSLYCSFDHGGVHFVSLDNATRTDGSLGDEQLRWLAADLMKQPPERPIVVFAHRPLADVAGEPKLEGRADADRKKALDLLAVHENVTVFFGHVHREMHDTSSKIAHHGARPLVRPETGASIEVAQRAPIRPVSREAATDEQPGLRCVQEVAGVCKLEETLLAKNGAQPL